MKAGPKLIALIEEHKVTLDGTLSGHCDQEVIILSRPKTGYWDVRESIDYGDNATTRRYRQELSGINEWLDQADITFEPTGFDKPVDAQARQLRRQFTLGRFDCGGRLFGGFWTACRSACACRAYASTARKLWGWTIRHSILGWPIT